MDLIRIAGFPDAVRRAATADDTPCRFLVTSVTVRHAPALLGHLEDQVEERGCSIHRVGRLRMLASLDNKLTIIAEVLVPMLSKDPLNADTGRSLHSCNQKSRDAQNRLFASLVPSTASNGLKNLPHPNLRLCRRLQNQISSVWTRTASSLVLSTASCGRKNLSPSAPPLVPWTARSEIHRCSPYRCFPTDVGLREEVKRSSASLAICSVTNRVCS